MKMMMTCALQCNWFLFVWSYSCWSC